MEEVRDGIRCVFAFGKDAASSVSSATSRGEIDGSIAYIRLSNPLPTGDHWKVIGWATTYLKRGESSLARVPNLRRDFIKRAAAELKEGRGFCMDLGSMAARKFRDENDLRMQRGKVFLLIEKVQLAVEESILP